MEMLAASASVLSIIDILGRALFKLHELRMRLKGADLTLLSLIGEFTATKAALQELHVCVNANANVEQHYELMMDFKSTIATCQLLVNVIDTRVSSLDVSKPRAISASRLRTVLTDHEITEHLGRLSRIISALNIVKEAFRRSVEPVLLRHNN